MVKTRQLIAVLLILLSLIGLSVTAWRRALRLTHVAPAPGSMEVQPFTPIRLTFSKPVRSDSALSRIKIEPARRGTFSWEGNTLIFTPHQPYPSGAQITVQVAAGIRANQILSLPLLKGQTWSFTTSQTWLAYLWGTAGTAELYALDPLTGDIRRITTTQNILDYAISADGRWFFLSVQFPGDDTALWRQARWETGQAPEQIGTPEVLLECLRAICRAPNPSPDGNWLAYERTPIDESGQPSDTSIWLLSLDQRVAQQASQAGHTALHPGWSASGWLSFYDTEQEGFLLQDSSGNELGFLPNRTGEAGSWSPAENSFVAQERSPEMTGSLGTSSPSRLLRYDLTKLDSHGVALALDLTQASQLEDSTPVYSPDGEWIAFARRYLDSSRWTPGKQLWLMRSDGSDAHPLTQAGDYSHHNFAWSPDGKQLAFVRFNQTILTEPTELRLINVDGSHPIELIKGGYAPQWIP